MKRIRTLIRRDLLSMSKDAIIIYSIVAPLLLAVGVRLFLPALGQATINVVVTEDLSAEMVGRLEAYLNVEVVSDQAALEQRVLALDDTAGILVDAQSDYRIVLEGNESHDTEVLPEMVLRRVLSSNDQEMTFETVEVAPTPFPFRELMGAFFALGVLSISSVVMSLNIVEDRESGTMRAMGVTPLGRGEYVLARSLLAGGLMLLTVFGSLWLLGLTGFNYLQVLVAVLVAALFAVLIGFVIGAISGNQIAALANIKFGVLLFLLPSFLTLLLPEQFAWTLAWVPTYWAFMIFRAILVDGVAWAGLWLPLLVNLLLSLVSIGIAYSWLKGKLAFARN